MNTGCIYFFKLVFSVVLDVYSGVEFLGHKVILCLGFWETTLLFSPVTETVCIPTNSVQEFSFLHILVDICYLCAFWW